MLGCWSHLVSPIAAEVVALAGYTMFRVINGLAKPAEEQTEFWSASWVSPVAAELVPRTPDDPAYDLTAAAYDEAGWNDRPAS